MASACVDATEATGTRGDLGTEIRKARLALGLSLRNAATPVAVSATYLQKIESGEATNPSPHILHRLSGVLGVPYAHLMELAGYVVPSCSERLGHHKRHILPINDLTPSERRAVTAFIAYLRSVRPQGS